MSDFQEPKTIICFGDSNTHGYNAANNGRFGKNQRWTSLLSQYLGDGYHVAEEGLSGRTTVFEDPLMEGFSGFSYLFPCMMTHEPVDLLIIMLGTNDTKERFHATAPNIAKGLERLVQKAIDTKAAWRTKPNILIIAPPPIEPDYENTPCAGDMGAGCAEKSRKLAPLYKNAAELLNCHFLDAGAIDGMKMNSYDFMHLTSESHKLLAEKLAKMIPGLI